MFLYTLQVNVIVQLIVVTFQIRARLLCVLPEVPFLQMFLVPEKHVVERPEASLSAGRFGRFRSQFGVRMHANLRVMPEHEAHPIAKRSRMIFIAACAWPHDGHSTSPYSMMVTGADAEPRM